MVSEDLRIFKDLELARLQFDRNVSFFLDRRGIIRNFRYALQERPYVLRFK